MSDPLYSTIPCWSIISLLIGCQGLYYLVYQWDIYKQPILNLQLPAGPPGSPMARLARPERWIFFSCQCHPRKLPSFMPTSMWWKWLYLGLLWGFKTLYGEDPVKNWATLKWIKCRLCLEISTAGRECLGIAAIAHNTKWLHGSSMSFPFLLIKIWMLHSFPMVQRHSEWVMIDGPLWCHHTWLAGKSLINGVFLLGNLPSGKLSHNYGKSQFLMGKSTISMGHFQ